MAKPPIQKKPPTRIPTDDYAVVVGGETYYPHAGEWVEMSTRTTVKETRALRRFMQFSTDMDAMDGDSEKGLEFLRILDEDFEVLTAGLASRVRAWSWTDDDGTPLPEPDGTSAPFENLSAEELFYLINLSNAGESAAASKNGSGAMPTSGSAFQPTPIQSASSMAPSRMKAT